MPVGATSSRGVLRRSVRCVLRACPTVVVVSWSGRMSSSTVPMWVHAPRPAVTEIRLYPVKSCRGHRVDRCGGRPVRLTG